ncbi:MAG TPA: alpha/beta fold hydrolase [Candidatus Melainabacteria bacterium]|nr:alpha/beta fold hydrolase [Candidatus Melainabacteria bacterium]
MQTNFAGKAGFSTDVTIHLDHKQLDGILSVPPVQKGLILFVHGSGSSRFSPRNRLVAKALNKEGMATLLFDLLTPEEERVDTCTAQLRFDIDFLSKRVNQIAKWVQNEKLLGHLSVGYFGASTGAAAALASAAQNSKLVKAIVSRGGRPDLAGNFLEKVECPSLFIVGQNDQEVLSLNKQAMGLMPEDTVKSLALIPGATHLFEEPGALESVSELAAGWFATYL